MALRDPRVAIIGAGMSGICAAAQLQRAGVRDFVLYEKSDQTGGVWQYNTYPGLFCDVPSRYFSFTFAPNPDWMRLFAPGPEIGAYLERVVRDRGIETHIRFGAEVEAATWTSQGRWCVRTTTGEEELFDFVIAATGVLHHPKVPSIPGLEDFAGAVFHSARWDHSAPLDGRRVAVIGNGATGVQLTQALAPRCAALRSCCFNAPRSGCCPSPTSTTAPGRDTCCDGPRRPIGCGDVWRTGSGRSSSRPLPRRGPARA